LQKQYKIKKIELGKHTDDAIAGLNLMTEEAHRTANFLKRLDAQRINKNDQIKQLLEDKKNNDIEYLRDTLLKILRDDEKEAEILFAEAKQLPSKEINSVFDSQIKI